MGAGRPPNSAAARRLYKKRPINSGPTSGEKWRWEDGTMATDLIGMARDGDGAAFAELTDPYRRELQVHCYRMLGSVQDAEDALQETLLAAWRGLGGFEGRASVRTWLYRIATSRCLDARRTASRRPKMDGPIFAS